MNCSFVLMSFNQEDYIADAVRAALAQEGPPLEIILSDDCSQDATFQIMQQIVAQYRGPHRVTLRRNERNLGLVRHFSAMFSLCSGDVMIVAWADDVAMPDRAVRIREVFETTDAWLVHSHAVCMDLDGRDIEPTYLGARMVSGGADLATLATSTSLYLGASGAYHRKLVQKYGHMTNPRVYEDLVYGFRAELEKGTRFIDRPLIRYRVGSGISTRHRLADAAAKRATGIQRLKVQYAVLSQRRRDALVFGLSSRGRIVRAINRQRVMILFQLYYLGAINGARCFGFMVRHPALAYRSLRLVLEQEKKIAKLAAAEARAL